MNCPEVFEKLFELCSGELSRAEDESLRAHVAGCATCGRDLAETEALLLAVRRCCGTEAAGEPRDLNMSELMAACSRVGAGRTASEKERTRDMKTEGRLSYKEKELVALGASLAAGCIPCTRHHAGEVVTAGASREEIDGAIDAALCVKGSTRGIMERAAHEALGSPVPADAGCCAGPTDRMKELVSIAASVAVNCPTNLEKHVQAGRAVGVRDDEMQIAIGLGRAMRAKASEKVDAAAASLSAPAAAAGESGCCGEAAAKMMPQAASACCAPAAPLPEVASGAGSKAGCC